MVADLRGEPCRNPILNPDLRPSHMYFANAWSGWAASASAHASVFNGVETLDSTSELWDDDGLWNCRHNRSAVYWYSCDQPVG